MKINEIFLIFAVPVSLKITAQFFNSLFLFVVGSAFEISSLPKPGCVLSAQSK